MKIKNQFCYLNLVRILIELLQFDSNPLITCMNRVRLHGLKLQDVTINILVFPGDNEYFFSISHVLVHAITD
jgi:hypothetical protein